MKLAVCLVVVAACQIDDNLVPCGDKLCPVGTVCLWSYDRCATPEQVDACRDVPTGLDCSTSEYETGGCFEGACLRRGCGNDFIEVDEVCDDGNERSLDGCSSDCRSNETCGNFHRDPGEDCDDGNLLSKDGCDSRCLAEVGTWREVPLGTNVSPYYVADDELRQRLVSVDEDRTWERVGDVWQSAPGAPGQVGPTYYDTVRNQVVSFVREQGIAPRAMAWSGTMWMPISESITFGADSATFDRARGQAVALVNETLRMLDASGNWVAYPTQPTLPYYSTVAFDPGNNDLLVFSEFGIESTLQYFNPATDSAWTNETMPSSSVSAFGLDGTSFVFVVGTKLYRRTATGWQTSTAEDLPLAGVSGSFGGIVYRRGATLVVEAGYSRCERTASTWSCTSTPSRDGARIAQDGEHQMRIVEGSYTWPVDQVLGARTSPGSTPAGFGVDEVVYSAGRRTMVATGTTPPCTDCPLETAVLGPSGWARLDSTDVYSGPIVYNPDARGVVHQVAVGGSAYRLLYDDSATWLDAAIPEGPVVFRYLAWDARRHNYVGTQSPLLYDLTDAGWVQDELAPVGDVAIEERSGGIVVIPPSDQNLVKVWERRGDAWSARPRLPYEVDFMASAYESDTGRLWVLARNGSRRIAFVHEYTSPTPLETCIDRTADVDGDGLIGKDDPDCYWAPDVYVCQPFVSCPVPI